MEAKAKAKELVEKITVKIFSSGCTVSKPMVRAIGIMMIDEILKELDGLHKPEYTTFRTYTGKQMDGYELIDFYKSVKKQITKL